jgi:hypothetical protein
MAARIYPWFVLVFWLASMTWLVANKVLPPLIGGNPPDYTLSLPLKEEKSEPVCWRIAWNDRRIGTAASQIIRLPAGGTAQRHVVHFEHLPLQAMLSESFGLLGSAFKPLLGTDSNVELDIVLATELRFNAQHRFTDFHSKADIGDIREFLEIRGVVDDENKLKLDSQIRASLVGQSKQVLRHEIPLPREALVSDAFAPRPELKNLSVGQRWTIPVYRPFPPNSAVQIIEAVAERLDVIVWDARDVETVLVVYREEAGTGLHSSREPVAREWIRADGTVIQREVRISGLKVVFERLNSKTIDPEIEMLDSDLHPRLWSD